MDAEHLAEQVNECVQVGHCRRWVCEHVFEHACSVYAIHHFGQFSVDGEELANARCWYAVAFEHWFDDALGAGGFAVCDSRDAQYGVLVDGMHVGFAALCDEVWDAWVVGIHCCFR